MAHKKNYKSVGYLYYEIDNVVLNPGCMMGKLSVVENNFEDMWMLCYLNMHM